MKPNTPVTHIVAAVCGVRGERGAGSGERRAESGDLKEFPSSRDLLFDPGKNW
jgi:hypothetical protein